MKNNTTLMIIDDDKDDRFFFRDAVNEINPNYKCVEAEHGSAAIELLNNTADLPDFIFLDLNMPLMDGKSCLIELKKNNRLKNIPVIIYSSVISERSSDDLLTCGASCFMIKEMELCKLPVEIMSAMKNAEGILSLWKRNFNWKNPFSFSLGSLKSLNSMSLDKVFPLVEENVCQMI